MNASIAEHQGPIHTNPIEIRSPQGDSLTVNPLGARIDVKLGKTLILTSVTRGDGKLGKTHPCTPIFGPDTNNLYGLSHNLTPFQINLGRGRDKKSRSWRQLNFFY